MAPSAAHLFLLREEKGKTEVLLQKRKGNIWASGWWDASAAGHVEKKEPMTKALIRESAEEIGVTIKKENIIFVYAQHAWKVFADDTDEKWVYCNGYFFVKEFDGTPKVCECDKCDCLKWFDVKKLPKKLIPTRKQAIEGYLAGESYGEFGWY